MINSAQAAAQQLFKKREPDMNEYRREQEAIHMNRERLRAERLAREAQTKTTTA